MQRTSGPWSLTELRALLEVYEREIRGAGFTEKTVNTYVDRPRRFLNWLDGSYRPAPRD